ncbi:hypothetical protein [Kordiimonas marina]|uniref:hypothetical protein n=1 Tax=Kordiimonas marina TaxID=2872312 RepID=UPI001FF355AC|nr:hypothetical protein [Kordiimonas marina]MCJ9428635.1 hypothetical protein [Kordiimonas marina]
MMHRQKHIVRHEAHPPAGASAHAPKGRLRLVPVLLLTLTLTACAGRQDAVQLMSSLSDTTEKAADATTKIHKAYTDEVASHIAARKAALSLEKLRQEAVIGQYKAQVDATFQTAKSQLMSDYADFVASVDQMSDKAVIDIKTKIPGMMKPLGDAFQALNTAAVKAKNIADTAGVDRTARRSEALLLAVRASFAASEYNRIEYEGFANALDQLAKEKAAILAQGKTIRDQKLQDLTAARDRCNTMLDAMKAPPPIGPDPEVPEEAFSALQNYLANVETAAKAMQRYMAENSFKSRFMSIASAFLGGVRNAAIGTITGQGNPVDWKSFIGSGKGLADMALASVKSEAQNVVDGAKSVWSSEKNKAAGQIGTAVKAAFEDRIDEWTKKNGAQTAPTTGAGGN